MRKRPDYMCAIASSLAYKEKEDEIIQGLASREIEGWEYFRVEVQSNDYDHFAIVLRHEEAKVAIVAHRGTSSFAHLRTDAYIAKHELPKKLIKVIRTYSAQVRECLPGYQFFETGHSMGAIFAEYNAHFFEDCHAITFDSPGCREALIKSEIKPNDQLVTAYLAAPNGINVAAMHVGEMIRLFVPYIRKGGPKLYEGVPVGSALNGIYGLAAGMLFNLIKNYVIQQHSMANLLDCFDAKLETPILQRKILQWPNLEKFMEWMLDKSNYDFFVWCDAHLSSTPQTRIYNQGMERRLKSCGVLLGGFVTPDWHSIEATFGDQKRYGVNAHNHFDEMFSNSEHREHLSRQLGFNQPYKPLQAGEGEHWMRKKQKVAQKDAAKKGAAVGAGLGAGVGGLSAKAAGVALLTSKGAFFVLGGAAVGGALLGAAAYKIAGDLVEAVDGDLRDSEEKNAALTTQLEDAKIERGSMRAQLEAAKIERGSMQAQLDEQNQNIAEMKQEMKQEMEQMMAQMMTQMRATQDQAVVVPAQAAAPAGIAPAAALFRQRENRLVEPAAQLHQPAAELH